MGGQPLAGGKPLATRKCFTGRKPTWLKHHQEWGKFAPTSISIPTTTGLYPGKPYLGVSNPLWGQLNPTSIPMQGNFSYKPVNPMIPMQNSLQPLYMWGP
jgi:hypothetical protein